MCSGSFDQIQRSWNQAEKPLLVRYLSVYVVGVKKTTPLFQKSTGYLAKGVVYSSSKNITMMHVNKWSNVNVKEVGMVSKV